MARIRVQVEPYDAAAETARLRAGRTDIGAIVAFSGLCRDEGGALEALELEHYPGMAEAELARIAAEAEARWPLLGLTIVHRSGVIAPGEEIVLVLAASAHRRAALEAVDFLMDFLKSRAPFWKRERRRDGAGDGWVEAKAQDERDLARWNAP